jgi:hypothetical protein
MNFSGTLPVSSAQSKSGCAPMTSPNGSAEVRPVNHSAGASGPLAASSSARDRASNSASWDPSSSGSRTTTIRSVAWLRPITVDITTDGLSAHREGRHGFEHRGQRPGAVPGIGDNRLGQGLKQVPRFLLMLKALASMKEEIRSKKRWQARHCTFRPRTARKKRQLRRAHRLPT